MPLTVRASLGIGMRASPFALLPYLLISRLLTSTRSLRSDRSAPATIGGTPELLPLAPVVHVLPVALQDSSGGHVVTVMEAAAWLPPVRGVAGHIVAAVVVNPAAAAPVAGPDAAAAGNSLTHSRRNLLAGDVSLTDYSAATVAVSPATPEAEYSETLTIDAPMAYMVRP